MNGRTQYFVKTMLDFFPSTIEKYKQSIEENGEVLETVIIEDIFTPHIINLLIEEKDTQLLKNIFDYFEVVSNCDDEYLINIFSITILESLGNDRAILSTAKKYMGSKTTELQIEADKVLGRA